MEIRERTGSFLRPFGTRLSLATISGGFTTG
jgi:hypothetical protein